MKILITGGAGFIGSALIRYMINYTDHEILNVDKLTYAGNLASLNTVESHCRYCFEQVDICDAENINHLFKKFQPDAVMHLAAESHVDRSITNPSAFIQTNIVGTYTLLNAAVNYWQHLSSDRKNKFRFHHISTDEVYGDLENINELFTESTPYSPSSPYSASKASSDHLVRAWHRTYELPIIITNCSNNYGPFQFPEKLIPKVMFNALNNIPIPVYGNGNQIRDWLYVDDHVRALYIVLRKGSIGETYNIGGHNEVQNIDVVNTICDALELLKPCKLLGLKSYKDLITFVADRPGHDKRYAIDATKIKNNLDWVPEETFESGIKKTVEWYLKNENWVNEIHKSNNVINEAQVETALDLL